jgi:hypothetical protein
VGLESRLSPGGLEPFDPAGDWGRLLLFRADALFPLQRQDAKMVGHSSECELVARPIVDDVFVVCRALPDRGDQGPSGALR